MLISPLRKALRDDLESVPTDRSLGSGWLSGVTAVVLALAGLSFVLALRYPAYLTMPMVRDYYATPWFRLALHVLLIGAFCMALLNLVLRPSKILGFTALVLTMLATLLGGSHVQAHGELTASWYLGLDWFVLNVLFTGVLFVPIEKFFARNKAQPLFRQEWREDLFYYLVSSLLVQILAFLSMLPAQTLLAHTHWDNFRTAVGAQPLVLQVIEIMFFTDLVQYWVHRLFHRIPFLWKFHAVHHGAKSMDWLAGARMHFFEIIALRSTTFIPMAILGFESSALSAYILLVYIHSSLVHANLGWNFDRIGPFLVTPRFHHWHHGIDKEAIDVNFAIHFPLFDRLFGTYHLPKSEWPTGYGIKNHPVPHGYWAQFLYPFKPKKKPAGDGPPAG